MSEVFDVAIIGAGPVGLHAALKSSLLNMTVAVIDKGRRHSRAFFVPRLANIPGHYGVSGANLLELQKDELKKHSDKARIIENTEVTDIVWNGDRFYLKCKSKETGLEVTAKNVILATGVVDRQPEIGGSIKPILPYADRGIAMYCMLCDGHSIKGKDACVLGHTAYSVSVAIDLLYFGPSSVTLLTNGMGILDRKTTEKLAENKIPVIAEEIVDLAGLKENSFGAVLKSGAMEFFDFCFVALGWYSMGTGLGLKLGGHVDEDGFLVTNEDGQILKEDGSPVEHIFAAGDVRNTWNQIPVGWGDAEKAVIYIWANYM